jgi:hypothetical protein
MEKRSAPCSATKGGSPMRKFFIIGLTLLCLGSFFPPIASKTFAKKQITTHLESQLGGKVEIDSVSLHWLGSQRCRHVVWTDPKHTFVCKSQEIEIHAGLLQCLRFKESPLNVTVKGAALQSDAELFFLKNKKKQGLLIEFPLIQAHLEKGTLSFGHTEVKLNGKMQMHTKGKIDLVSNRLDLIVGIPAKILRKVVKIKEIPDFFVLELPISTTLSSKSIEQELFFSLLSKNQFLTEN